MIAQPQKAIRNRILKTTKKVAVLGGGSWATAIVKLLTENKRNVLWYMRNEQAITHLEKWGVTRITCHQPNSRKNAFH